MSRNFRNEKITKKRKYAYQIGPTRRPELAYRANPRILPTLIGIKQTTSTLQTHGARNKEKSMATKTNEHTAKILIDTHTGTLQTQTRKIDGYKNHTRTQKSTTKILTQEMKNTQTRT
jgi:hypothetical protein